MTFSSSLAGLFAATLVAAIPSSASAAPILPDAGHLGLLEAVANTGTAVYVNPLDCFEEGAGFDGFYASSARVLVICQDNAVKGEPSVEWTDNDLDTIRHEAHHLLQDCMDGTIADDGLRNVYPNQHQLGEYAVRMGLSPREVELIAESYAGRGADYNTILLEIEAFATARGVSPDKIADAIEYACPAG